jgi:divalent metal cation (Fe/Co/Zn/Cd) transporter
MSSGAGQRGAASIELRMRLTRIFSKMLVLTFITILGYVLLPYLNEVTLVVPFLGLPLVSLGAVFLLAVIGVLLYRIVGDILALNTSASRQLRRIMKGLATEHISAIRRVIYDLIILVVILIAFTIMLPILGRVPGIGIYLATAIPLLTLAIAVLIFWDLGKVAYSLVERLADYIADRLEEIEEGRDVGR